MRLRKIGTFHDKGSPGISVEAVDRPHGQPRYAAIGYGDMEEAESRALDRGATIDSTILDHDIDGWLHTRIDACFGYGTSSERTDQ